ncbi:DUF937 domain-containing protein [Hymenobacter sp.]|uniref:DUF937 domain-containing protein n=1 Tax=Hymenobacter sp. TaxID=1898978 RepID=UPI00286CD948|nr:DUF937 domain-containing protein [Hymenobacter sp.]
MSHQFIYMLSLLDTIKSTFSPELINHVAGRLGERKQGISQALNGAMPVLLGSMARQVRTGDALFCHQFPIEAAHPFNGSYSTLTGMLGMLGGGYAAGSALQRGEALLVSLFGTGSAALAGAISCYARIKLASAKVVLQLLAAVLPALVGQYAARHRLRTKGLAAVLSRQKMQARWDLLPAELRGLTGVAGPGGFAASAALVAAPLRAATAIRRRAARMVGARWYRMMTTFASFVLLGFCA